MDIDLQIRLATFNWLSEQTNILGEVLPRNLLQQGFEFRNQRVPLVAPNGIFKPKIMELPLTITTTVQGPYDDDLYLSGKDDFLNYKYRGTDPNHHDNVGLRKVFEQQKPLVYLHGIDPGKYLAFWPVYIIADDKSNLTFKAALDNMASLQDGEFLPHQINENALGRQAYITSTVKVRLHQRSFREKVLRAYKSQCTLCRLKHPELLDAAHIIPDNLPESTYSIDNGLSLCKLHHAAYDRLLLGITPDYKIHVRNDILREEDGPVLKHGLIGLHQSQISLPKFKKYWPNQEYLDWRYEKFVNAE